MKTIFYSVMIMGVLTGCQNAEMNNEIVRLKDEKKQLKTESERKDSVILTIIQSFNDIEDNLSAIKQKQGIITLNTNSSQESDLTKREQIIEDISEINLLMEDNKNKISILSKKVNSLNKELKSAGIKMAEFEKMLARLTNAMEEKDVEINSLKINLIAMNFSLDSLVLEYKEQSKVVKNQLVALNTGYFCFGTFKELKVKGIITKEGGFIGMGRTEKLLKDFNKNYFTKIDISQSQTIDLYSKSAKMITSHPSGSYKFEGEKASVNKLVIIDPVEFWGASKYLVIMVE